MGTEVEKPECESCVQGAPSGWLRVSVADSPGGAVGTRALSSACPCAAPGLSLGDVPSRQPIGIVLTVLGVVVLDFSADATEGPIRAYLLDVVDSEEQDMALNIHAFSAGEHPSSPAPPGQGPWSAWASTPPVQLHRRRPRGGSEQGPPAQWGWDGASRPLA